MTKYTKEEILCWYKDYKKGSTLPLLSKKFKVPIASIRCCFKKNKLSTNSISKGVKIGTKYMSSIRKKRWKKTLFKKGNIPWNYKPIQKKEIEDFYNKGLSSLQIAKKFNVSKRTILRKFKKYGIKINPKIKNRGQRKKGSEPWNKGKTNVYNQATIEKIRCARLKQIYPKKNTLPERIFEKELIKNNICYKKQHPIYKICQVDFFIEPNIIIFVDGDYWHANPLFYKDKKLTQAQLKNIKRDKMQNRLLEWSGFKVFRFWENDLKANANFCFESINLESNNYNHA